MARGPRLQTKADLKAYMLRKLGSPVINIEITDDQMEDAVDDTLERYLARAYAGTCDRYLMLNVKTGVGSYQLPYDVFAVLETIGQGMLGITNGNPSGTFSMNQYVASDLYRGTGRIDMLSYELTNQMLSNIELLFTQNITFDFNCISKELLLYEVPQFDQQVMVHCYRKNLPVDVANPLAGQAGQPDTVESTNIYNELWIRQYATEMARYQWSSNLLKYSGSQLPNGLNIDVPSMLNEAKENLARLEEKLSDYELPIDMMIG